MNERPRPAPADADHGLTLNMEATMKNAQSVLPRPHPRYAKLAAEVGLPADSFEALDAIQEMRNALDADFLRAVGIALEG